MNISYVQCDAVDKVSHGCPVKGDPSDAFIVVS